MENIKNTQNLPLVSIIIPVYNTEKYLARCLDSVCTQSYSQLEIIVINDGSTDNSGIILQEYAHKDSRIQIITQKNQGVSSARNAGLDFSSGEYVIFLDSDDWIDMNTCSMAIQMINEANFDVVMWSYVKEQFESSRPIYLFDNHIHMWDETNIKRLYKRLIGPQGEQLREPWKANSLITVWGKLYRKTVIGDVRFVDIKMVGTGEDALFNIQVFSQVERAVYIPNTFSHYRKTNMNSLTKGYKKQLVYQWQKLYQKIEIHLGSENATQEYYQALNNYIALNLIGLGLNLAGDDALNFIQKMKELKKILQMSHYRKALASLPLNYFQPHWKLFFICARLKWSFPLCVLLLTMNWMRGR